MSVFRCYAEKKPGFDVEAQGLWKQLREQLGLESLEGVRILNRYDADRIAPEVYQAAKTVVFSEPQEAHAVLAVEALPGQFDQRADSCAQCIQLQSGVDRPLIATAKVYLLMGTLTEAELDKVRRYLINPVESREASLDKPATLEREHQEPGSVPAVEGFTAMGEAALKELLDSLGLAMDLDDLKFLQTYFRDQEKRDPTITEVRVVDTYWSDHCRHTTFSNHLLHPHRPGGRRRPGDPRRLPAVSGRPGGGVRGGEGRPAAPDPHGPGHHRGQDPEEAGEPARAGRERGDQRLLHPRPRPGGREDGGLAPHVQE